MPLAVVTGANTGIGFHTAAQLATKGWDVVCAFRRPERAAEVRQSLKEWYGKSISLEKLEFSELDLASFASVQAFASGLAARHSSVDLLVCNAGVNSAAVPQEPSAQLTEDGVDVLYQTNFLAHFLLVLLLLPLLRRVNGRVVNVSSAVHRSADPRDFGLVRTVRDPYVSFYGLSKLAQVVTSLELHRRFGRHGVSFHSVNPGGVASDIWRGYSPVKQFLFRTVLQNTETAAQTVVKVGLSLDGQAPTSPRYYNGYLGASMLSLFEYWSPQAARDSLVASKPSRDARDPELGRQVFEDSVAILREAGIDVDAGSGVEQGLPPPGAEEEGPAWLAEVAAAAAAAGARFQAEEATEEDPGAGGQGHEGGGGAGVSAAVREEISRSEALFRAVAESAARAQDRMAGPEEPP